MIDQDKRRVGWFHWGVLFVGICMIVYGMNSDAVVQEVPVVDAAAIQRLQKENELLARKVADYKALSANLAGRLKEANGRLAKLEEERNVLAHSSVPSQPVILEAVRFAVLAGVRSACKDAYDFLQSPEVQKWRKERT